MNEAILENLRPWFSGGRGEMFWLLFWKSLSNSCVKDGFEDSGGREVI